MADTFKGSGFQNSHTDGVYFRLEEVVDGSTLEVLKWIEELRSNVEFIQLLVDDLWEARQGLLVLEDFTELDFTGLGE